MPHIQDLAANLHGMQVFSEVDLVRAYHRIPVAPDDVRKTAICIHSFYSNLFGCPLDCGMKFSHSNESWTKSYEVCRMSTRTLKTCKSLVVAGRDSTCDSYLTDSQAQIHKGGLSTNLGLCASRDAFRCVLDQGSDTPWSVTRRNGFVVRSLAAIHKERYS